MVKLFYAFYILSAPVTPQHNCPSVQIYYHIYILLIWMATRFLSLILDCPISTQSAARSARADSGLPPFTIPPNTVNEAGPWHMLTTVPLPQTSPQPNMPLHEEHKTCPPCSSTSPSFHSMHLKQVTTTDSLCRLHLSKLGLMTSSPASTLVALCEWVASRKKSSLEVPVNSPIRSSQHAGHHN